MKSLNFIVGGITSISGYVPALRRLFILSGLTIGLSAQLVPEDRYLTGISLVSSTGCPIFVGTVAGGSPASKARILPGDHLIAVEQISVTTLAQAAKLLRSDTPNPVRLKLNRKGRELELMCRRERQSTIVARGGEKLVSGAIVPIDTVQREVDRMLTFDGKRYVARVFPSHYPRAQNLYYGGFEIFILKDPAEVTIGGIEKGPASKAGAHWGDDLLSVNGVPIAGKSPDQMEGMFASDRPAPMKLVVSRLGVVQTFQFRLEAAKDVANQNGKRFVVTRIVPSWALDQDMHCFLK